MTKSDAAMLAALAALTLLLRLPFFPWPLTGDEGNYAYTAYWWAHGRTLYADFLGLEKPQGVFLSYWLAQTILGGGTWAIRLWSGFWAAGTTAAVFLTAKTLISRKTAVLAALFVAVFSTAPPVEGFTANAELFMVLPLCLSALALWQGKPFQAGLWAGCALLFKISAISGVGLIGFWFAVQRVPLRIWLRAILGLALPIGLAILHGTLTVGLPAYLFATVFFRAGVGWDYVASIGGSLSDHLSQTAAIWIPLGFLTGVGIRRFSTDRRLFLLAWMVVSILGIAMGGDLNLHYLIQALPAFSIPAAAGAVFLLKEASPHLRWFGLTIIAVCTVSLGIWFTKPPQQGSWDLYHRIGIQIGEEIGAYIQSHSASGDTIYVAYYQANIYYQSGRRAAVPFLSRVQLLYLPGAYDRLLDAIRSRDPVYVVVLGQTLDGYDGGEGFTNLLNAGYRIEKTFDGVLLYRRINENGASPEAP